MQNTNLQYLLFRFSLLLWPEDFDSKLFYRKQSESHYVDATEITRSVPTNNSLQHYENANVPPQIDEAPYLTTSVPVRPRNSTYENEGVQAAAAGSTYANEIPLNRDSSFAYENNTSDITTSRGKHVYEDI